MSDFLYFKLKKKEKLKKKAFLGTWTNNFLNKRENLQSVFINYESYENYNKQEIEIKKVKKFSKKILTQLSKKLNNLNNMNWNFKSWNYILMPFLETYVAIIFDRIQMAKALKKNSKIDKKAIYQLGKNSLLISNDYKEFTSNISEVAWNKKLVSKIYYLLQNKKYLNNLDLFYKKKIKKKFYKKKYIIYSIKNSFLKIFERILCGRDKFFFYLGFGNIFSFIYLNLKLRQFPFFYAYNFINEFVAKYNANLKVRRNLKINFHQLNFEEKIVCKLLPEIFPTIYLEGLKKQISLVDKSFLPKTKKIIITKSIFKDNLFKFWTANNLSNGSKIVFIQHGSGYGYKRSFQNEDYEIDVSHKFLSWGWKKNKKVIPLGNFSLSQKKNFPIQQKKHLLIILGLRNFFKIQNNLFSHNDLLEQINNINYLLSNINYSHFEKVSVKDHPTSLKKTSLKIPNTNKNKVVFEKLDKNLNELYNDYSLVITTYDSTEFYNLIARDKPCLQILSKKLIKKQYIRQFKEMYKYGILHDDANSLIKQLQKIQNNPYKWWSNRLLSKKRKVFCNHFIKTDINSTMLLKSLNNIKL